MNSAEEWAMMQSRERRRREEGEEGRGGRSERPWAVAGSSLLLFCSCCCSCACLAVVRHSHAPPAQLGPSSVIRTSPLANPADLSLAWAMVMVARIPFSSLSLSSSLLLSPGLVLLRLLSRTSARRRLYAVCPSRAIASPSLHSISFCPLPVARVVFWFSCVLLLRVHDLC